MKNVRKIASASLLACTMAMPVMAHEKGVSYFGAAFNVGSFENNEIGDADFNGLKIDAGKYLLPHIAIVTHIIGGNNDTVNYQTEELTVDFKYLGSVMLRGDIEVIDNLNIYGLAGISYGKVSAEAKSAGTFEYTAISDTSLSYGLGIEWIFDKMLGVYAEYVSYNSESTFEFNSLSLGLRTTF